MSETVSAWGSSTSAATIVCSDSPRNGKTLFAKLAADLLRLRMGVAPTIFDTDEPDGQLIHHFPDTGKVMDLSKTGAQVALFDGMLSEPGTHFLIDLSARHLERFFSIYRDIDFEDGASECGLDISVFYLIDRTPHSIETASALAASIPKTRIIPVRNAAIGDALAETNMADVYQSIRFEREINLPVLSAEALGMLEHPDFHFDTFVAGNYDHFPAELKYELWGFLESLYEQRDSVDGGATHPV